MKYDISKEYVNIENYSPFSAVNGISLEFQKNPFFLPFIKMFGEEKPVHPDMFHDLNLDSRMITHREFVYPTSSFRTVYNPEENACYKLPVLRLITRSIRDLPEKELERSRLASKLLSSQSFPGFDFLDEEAHSAQDPHFNYINRKMPETDFFPWFYVIRSQRFDKDFEVRCAKQLIRAWMFHASVGIFFESFHTQNLLVNSNADVIYRDLSDVRTDKRSPENSILVPSYYDELSGPGEMLSISFDRSVCNQNLNHLFRYGKNLGEQERDDIRECIKTEIKKYNLPFPDYSLDYSHDSPSRIPTRVKLTDWRQ